MFTISKEFHFSASHRLDHLHDTHQCARLHGHNYRVVVVLRAAATYPETGFVVDYGELTPLKEFIDTQLDHRHLNDVLGGSRATTAEHMARMFFEFCVARWPETVAVRVSETDKTWAEYAL